MSEAPRRRGIPRPAHVLIAVALLAMGAVYFGNSFAIAIEPDVPSVSVGRPAAGRLENAKRLPTSGPNFRAYSRLGTLLGRNSVNGSVRATMLEAYRDLERLQPGVTYIYGETGWPRGGPFPPHRTHQNGLSVDFMVPVRESPGLPAVLPTAPWRKFGYAIEFDSAGRSGYLTIDYAAVAAHLIALEHAARRHGLAIELVIFDPPYRRAVMRTAQGQKFLRALPWMQGRPWVRHDEHYHVDFRVVRR